MPFEKKFKKFSAKKFDKEKKSAKFDGKSAKFDEKISKIRRK
jgi:hypothetical protein